jgi:hypothetical protein
MVGERAIYGIHPMLDFMESEPKALIPCRHAKTEHGYAHHASGGGLSHPTSSRELLKTHLIEDCQLKLPK